MPTLQDILQTSTLPGHGFDAQHYIAADIHSGMLANRSGHRLAAFSPMLLRAIYSGLEYETGQAMRLVLTHCGLKWGREFCQRFEREISTYQGRSVKDLSMGVLIDSLTDWWATHGWGKLQIDFDWRDRGLAQVSVTGSGFAAAARDYAIARGQDAASTPSCHLEVGVLASLFSRLSDRDLICVQTQCESMGADCNRFLLGTQERLQGCETWVEEGQSHREILDHLVGT